MLKVHFSTPNAIKDGLHPKNLSVTELLANNGTFKQQMHSQYILQSKSPTKYIRPGLVIM
jgi:hypothetical protein